MARYVTIREISCLLKQEQKFSKHILYDADGQRRPCYIYRLVCTATLDEKILQRQLLKKDVAEALGHGRGQGKQGQKQGAGLSRTELRELFALNPRIPPTEGCDTRRMLLARACATGKVTEAGRNDATVRLADYWPQWGGPESLSDDPPVVRAAACSLGGSGLVTYVKTERYNSSEESSMPVIEVPASLPPPSAGCSVAQVGADMLELS